MKILAIISAAVICISCGKNECDTACDPILPPVNFKIVNASGTNLVSGPGKIYNLGNIAIKSMVGTTLTTDTLTFNGDGNLASTPLVFTASGQVTQYYLYINNVKTDSFQLTYQAMEGKTTCCPQFTAITALKLNNTATTYTSPGNTTPVNVVK